MRPRRDRLGRDRLNRSPRPTPTIRQTVHHLRQPHHVTRPTDRSDLASRDVPGCIAGRRCRRHGRHGADRRLRSGQPVDPVLDELQKQRADVQSKKARPGVTGQHARGERRRGDRRAPDPQRQRRAPSRTGSKRPSGPWPRPRPTRRPPRTPRSRPRPSSTRSAPTCASPRSRPTCRPAARTPRRSEADDVNEAVAMRTLMSMRANENLDLAEQYRSKQEDLEIQRAAAADARERADAAQAPRRPEAEGAEDGAGPAAGLRRPGRGPARTPPWPRPTRSARSTRTSRCADLDQAGRDRQGARGPARRRGCPRRGTSRGQTEPRSPPSGRWRWWRRRRRPRSISGAVAIVTSAASRSSASIAGNVQALLDRSVPPTASTSAAAATAIPPARSPCAEQLRFEQLRHLRDARIVVLARRRPGRAPRCTSVVSPSTSPQGGCTLTRGVVRLRLAQGQRRRFGLLQPAVRALALVHQRPVTPAVDARVERRSSSSDRYPRSGDDLSTMCCAAVSQAGSSHGAAVSHPRERVA